VGNKYESTSVKLNLVKLYTLLFVFYIHEKQDNKNQKDQLLYSLVYYKIETCLKCIAQLFNETATYDRTEQESLLKIFHCTKVL